MKRLHGACFSFLQSFSFAHVNQVGIKDLKEIYHKRVKCKMHEIMCLDKPEKKFEE